eukprot:g19383.t1
MNRLPAIRKAREDELLKLAPPDTSAKQVSILAKAAAQAVKEADDEALIRQMNDEASQLLPIEDEVYFDHDPQQFSSAAAEVPALPDRLGGALGGKQAGVFQVVPPGQDELALHPVVAAPNKQPAISFRSDYLENDAPLECDALASPLKSKPLKPMPSEAEQEAEPESLPQSPKVVLPAQLSWKEVVEGMAKAKKNGLPSAQFPGAHKAVGDSDEESETVPKVEEGGARCDPFNFDSEITTQAPGSVKQYKAQHIQRYVLLMRALGFSTKRHLVTPDSITALFKAFWVCGDFPRSKAQHFSWIKKYIQKKLYFSNELQSACSRCFRVLSKAKPAMSQEAAIRLSALIQIIQACEDSMDFVMFTTRKKNTMGKGMPITVSNVIRHIIACWFAFLRPNEAGTTSRTISYSAGRWNVRYVIPYRKNSQRQPVALGMVCCCGYTPWVKPPICPVHCATDTSWKMMNTYVDDDEWRQAIRHLVFHAGFPLKVKNCRHKWGAYSVRIGGAQSARDAGLSEEQTQKVGWWSSDKTSQHYQGFASICADTIAIEWPPALDQIARARLHQEITGAGVASDAQRDTILKKSEELEEGCSEAQYLALSRAMESSDIKKCFASAAVGPMGWRPFSFIAALYAIGAITVEAAKGYQKFITKSILGSIEPTVKRSPLPADTVFAAFWETLRLLMGGDYLATLTKAGGESTAKFYQRRVGTTLDTMLVMKLDLALDRIRFAEELALKSAVVQVQTQVSNGNGGGQSNQPNPNSRAARRARARAANSTPYTPTTNTNAPAPAPAAQQRRPATSRKSPFRTAAERRVCPGYVDGSCTAVAKGGTCPRGRHGGSEERITFVSNTMIAPEKRPTPEQIKEKATE